MQVRACGQNPGQKERKGLCAQGRKKEKALAMYDTTQSITEVIRRLGYPINRKNGERRYRYQYLFLRYRFFGYLQNNPLNDMYPIFWTQSVELNN